jgi:hypothetical protein
LGEIESRHGLGEATHLSPASPFERPREEGPDEPDKSEECRANPLAPSRTEDHPDEDRRDNGARPRGDEHRDSGAAEHVSEANGKLGHDRPGLVRLRFG